MVALAILVAVVVILQLLGSFIHFGPVSVSLVLIPIVVGAALFGPGAGALLGFAFSAVVFIATVTGADAGAFMLWQANPFMTALVIFAKGTGAGWVSGLVYRSLCEKNALTAAAAAAVVCPVFNTGVFLLGMVLFFQETLRAWAAGSALLTYVLFGLTGVNFLVELGLNLVLSPAVSTLIRAILGQREYEGKITFHAADGRAEKLRIGYVPPLRTISAVAWVRSTATRADQRTSRSELTQRSTARR